MLSTPLTCCSIGVATACSRPCASAPTYVACNLISGGTMFGNCATGRAAIVTAPTITVRIEMTMATIGRFMKNFDNLLPLVTFRLFLADPFRGEWLRIHCLARNGLLCALDDHALTELQSYRD